ncbi:MAG: hypothetical protein RL189_678 [Pseudomonadota bacterium]
MNSSKSGILREKSEKNLMIARESRKLVREKATMALGAFQSHGASLPNRVLECYVSRVNFSLVPWFIGWDV